MLRKIIINTCICLALASNFTTSQAQELVRPDYTLIKRITSNQQSPHFFRKLMDRYLENDTTLSILQYRYLYYGFTLQEDFRPYQEETLPLIDCRRNMIKTAADKAICTHAIEIAQKVLDDNPFHMPAISMMALAYLQLGDTLSYHLWDCKQKGILDAILSSGDGDTPETAFHVTNIEHEYEIINRLGLHIEYDSLCNEGVEYLKVKENSLGERGFYFNFEACNSVYRKKYE